MSQDAIDMEEQISRGEPTMTHLLRRLDGRTGEEVIEYADSLRRGR